MARVVTVVLAGALLLAGCTGDPVVVATTSPSPTQSTTAPVGPAAPTPAAGDDVVEVVGELPAEVGDELSGIAASRVHDGVWIVDDEPGTDRIHLVALDGRLLATVVLTGVDTVNPEDIAVGPCPDEPDGACVHVADIGDNVEARRDVVVLSVPEDVTTAEGGEVAIAPAVRRLVYEDGPVDAEALVVAADGTIVVIDKVTDVAGVHAAVPGEDVLRRVATIDVPPPQRPFLSLVTGVVATGADLRPDGRALLLRTYDQLLELTAPDAEDAFDPATLGSWLVTQHEAPTEPQGEAVAWLGADTAVTVSEGSVLVRVTRLGR